MRSLQTSHTSHQDIADDYYGVITQLCHEHRVITCKDHLQWVLQQRREGRAERPWRARHYCRTRKALIRLSAGLCGDVDPVAISILAALPERITQRATC